MTRFSITKHMPGYLPESDPIEIEDDDHAGALIACLEAVADEFVDAAEHLHETASLLAEEAEDYENAWKTLQRADSLAAKALNMRTMAGHLAPDADVLFQAIDVLLLDRAKSLLLDADGANLDSTDRDNFVLSIMESVGDADAPYTCLIPF